MPSVSAFRPFICPSPFFSTSLLLRGHVGTGVGCSFLEFCLLCFKDWCDLLSQSRRLFATHFHLLSTGSCKGSYPFSFTCRSWCQAWSSDTLRTIQPSLESSCMVYKVTGSRGKTPRDYIRASLTRFHFNFQEGMSFHWGEGFSSSSLRHQNRQIRSWHRTIHRVFIYLFRWRECMDLSGWPGKWSHSYS